MLAEKKHSWLVALLIAFLLIFGIARQISQSHKVAEAPSVPTHTVSQATLKTAFLMPTPVPFPAFQLLNEKGQPFSQKDLSKKWHLVFMGYTHCPDICPATMALLKQVFIQLAPYEDIDLLFLSADPEHDTPEVLDAFLKPYSSTRFHGLTGDPKVIQALIQQLGLYASPLDEKNELVHQGTLLLINPQGEWVATISNSSDLDALVHDIEVIQGRRAN